jgi:HK97 family phage portal protein
VAVVQSAGSLTSVGRGEPVTIRRAVELSPNLSSAYGALWRSQPQVRTVTTFLGRNIAQLGLHVFRRVGDNERRRLTDHAAARTIAQPNPLTTRYDWVDRLVLDLAIYDNAYQLKVRRADGGVSLLRLPPRRTSPTGDNWWAPDGYEVVGARDKRRFRPDEVIHFHGYNPDDDRVGVSPLETLRRVLAEEWAAAGYREQFWNNGARISGYLSRPADAGDWDDDTRQRFVDEWREIYTGQGAGAGGTPILEDGMTYSAASFSPEQAQYIEARKLTREEVTAAYHIPAPFVGILEHATFSNITEQHKNLYQDTLGPYLQMITQRLELGLLVDLPDTADVYLEFNLDEKMRGSFEEQAAVLQTATGGPWLTRNEARARQNLPPVDGADELIVPLNVVAGGQASPTDSAPPKAGMPAGMKSRAVSLKAPTGGGSGPWADKYEEALAAFFARQGEVIARRLGAKARGKATLDDVLPDRPRWEAELADDLYGVGALAAAAAARKVLDELELDPDEFDEEPMAAWLRSNADGVSAGINGRTASELEAALADDDPKGAVARLFELAVTVRAVQGAVTQATAIAGFGGREGAKRGGLNRKVWRTRSSKPRPAHARMDGQTVDIDSTFSNGARWPGDSTLDDDDRAGCTCDLEFIREED